MRHKFSVFCFTAALIFSSPAVVSKEMSASVDDPWSRIMKRLQEREAARKGGGPSPSTPMRTATQILQRAENAYSNGDKNAALQDAQIAISSGIHTVRAYSLLGKCLRDAKRYSEAINAFDRALQISPSNGEVRLLRATVLMRQKKYDLAKDDIDQAMSNNPDSRAYFGRASFYFAVSEYEKAIDDLNSALRLDPNLPEGYRLRAMCYEKLGRAEEQRSDIAKAESLQRSR